MTKDISKIARERRKRAREMHYDDKISLILNVLAGHPLWSKGIEGSARYSTDNLYIEKTWEGDAGWSHGEAYAWGNDWWAIDYKEKRVYRKANKRITKYIPGKWEDEFNDLYMKAERKRKRIISKEKKERKKKKRTNKTEYQRRLKRDFGIEE